MNLKNNNTYSHFTQEERYRIQIGREEGKSMSMIARELGVNKSSVSREIKRNSVLIRRENKSTKKYEPDYFEVVEYKTESAQALYCGKRCGNYKLDRIAGLMGRINNLIKEKYHPEVIANKTGNAVCSKTIYNYMLAGLIDKGRIKLRKKQHKSPSRVHKRLLGISIEQRPDISSREEFGHIEGDLVLGSKSSKEVWLTLVERKTRNAFVYRLPDRKALTVLIAMKKFLRRNKWVKSITFDNGSEFALCHTLKNPVYFAHPYSSWERGSNENFNKLLRRELPKGRNLALYTKEQLQSALNFINNLPRKILDFKSSNQLFLFELLSA
jgi:IS30 family transposase